MQHVCWNIITYKWSKNKCEIMCSIGIHIYMYILLNVKLLATRKKTNGNPTLPLVPLVFFRVVVDVTTGVDVVFRSISYFSVN